MGRRASSTTASFLVATMLLVTGHPTLALAGVGAPGDEAPTASPTADAPAPPTPGEPAAGAPATAAGTAEPATSSGEAAAPEMAEPAQTEPMPTAPVQTEPAQAAARPSEVPPVPAQDAQAPDSPAGLAPEDEGDSMEERRLVAFVATGVAAVSLATGIVFGVLAQEQFNCARDVVACNASLEDKVVGTELFDLRADVEQKALLADMGYLFAGAAGVVAAVGYLRSFPWNAAEAPALLGARATPESSAGVTP